VPNSNIASRLRGQLGVTYEDGIMVQGKFRDWTFDPHIFSREGFGVCHLCDAPFILNVNLRDFHVRNAPFVGRHLFNSLWMCVYSPHLVRDRRETLYNNISFRVKWLTGAIRNIFGINGDNLEYYRRMAVEQSMRSMNSPIYDIVGVPVRGSTIEVRFTHRGAKYQYPIYVSGHMMGAILSSFLDLHDMVLYQSFIKQNVVKTHGTRVEGRHPSLWHWYADWKYGVIAAELFLNDFMPSVHFDSSPILSWLKQLAAEYPKFNKLPLHMRSQSYAEDVRPASRYPIV
jgi:hypothetical protein